MKTLIRTMALFLTGLLFVLVAASVYYELRVRQQDDFYRQVADFKHPSVQPTVLLVGDSRMAVGIDPGMLPEGVYNFSRSEEHTSELQSLMRNSYAVFCLKKKKN